jgi:hypothetical protein
MYSNIEAQVVIAKCKESKKIYGIRMEKTPWGWEYNWAFPISEKRAKAIATGAVVGGILSGEVGAAAGAIIANENAKQQQ